MPSMPSRARPVAQPLPAPAAMQPTSPAGWGRVPGGGAGGAAVAGAGGDAADVAGGLGQRAGGGGGLEARDRVPGEGADIDALVVGADRDHVGTAEAAADDAAGEGYAGHAAAAVEGLGEGAGLAVAMEDGDGLAFEGGGVDVGAVGTDRDRVGPVEADRRRAAAGAFERDAAAFALGLTQGPVARIAAEDRDRVAAGGGDVEVLAVGAEGEGAGPEQGGGRLQRPGRAASALMGRAVDQAALRSGELYQHSYRLRLRWLAGLWLRCGQRRGRDGQRHEGGQGAERQGPRVPRGIESTHERWLSTRNRAPAGGSGRA